MQFKRVGSRRSAPGRWRVSSCGMCSIEGQPAANLWHDARVLASFPCVGPARINGKLFVRPAGRWPPRTSPSTPSAPGTPTPPSCGTRWEQRHVECGYQCTRGCQCISRYYCTHGAGRVEVALRLRGCCLAAFPPASCKRIASRCPQAVAASQSRSVRTPRPLPASCAPDRRHCPHPRRPSQGGPAFPPPNTSLVIVHNQTNHTL